jgi:peptidoglycan/LPS O-acetylase OafA/YrhL
MIFHFNIFFLPQAALSHLLPFMHPVFAHGYLAVDLFFLMSGFVMAHVYGAKLSSNWRENWRDFLAMRFARIYPLFALTTLAIVLTHVLAPTPLSSISFSPRRLALYPLLLQAWRDLSWNYSSWSIGMEAEAYVFFVLAAGALLRGKYPRCLAVVCVAILAALCVRYGGRLNHFSRTPALLRTISEFSTGVLLYRAHLAAKKPSDFWPVLLIVVCVMFGALTGWDLGAVGVFACLVYWGVNTMSPLARLLGSRPAMALGAWSYSIFLWHVPVHYGVMAIFSASGHPTETLGIMRARLLMLATMVGVIGLSALTFNFIEVPARRWIRRKLLHAGPVAAMGV